MTGESDSRNGTKRGVYKEIARWVGFGITLFIFWYTGIKDESADRIKLENRISTLEASQKDHVEDRTEYFKQLAGVVTVVEGMNKNLDRYQAENDRVHRDLRDKIRRLEDRIFR